LGEYGLIKLKPVLSILILLTVFVSCNTNKKPGKLPKADLKLSVEIIPEGDSSYSITWKDTVGQSRGYSFHKRPREVWCILTDAKDTAGHYWGVSTPTNYTYFITTDSVITASFMIGPNIFSDDFQENKEKKGFEEWKKIIEFNPVQINIKNNLRKKLEFELTEK
jgi:hypothetical protein